MPNLHPPLRTKFRIDIEQLHKTLEHFRGRRSGRTYASLVVLIQHADFGFERAHFVVRHRNHIDKLMSTAAAIAMGLEFKVERHSQCELMIGDMILHFEHRQPTTGKGHHDPILYDHYALPELDLDEL